MEAGIGGTGKRNMSVITSNNTSQHYSLGTGSVCVCVGGSVDVRERERERECVYS